MRELAVRVVRARCPSRVSQFEWSAGPLNANMDKFAKLWPDTLSTLETSRDLDYEPDVTLPAMVAGVLNAHSSRRLSSKAMFRWVDVSSEPQPRPNPQPATQSKSQP